MLGVAPSGYYDWKVRPPSARTLRHAWLAGEIAQVHKDSGGTYGTLRITAELRYGRGIHVGKEQVHLLMRRLGSGDSGWRLGTAPAGGEKGPYTEYELESCPSLEGCIAPTDTAIAPDGSVWYTTTNNEIGRLNATHTELENFSMTSIAPGFAEGKPARITAAPDGTIWVSESGFYGHSSANALVRIVPSAVPTTTVYQLGSDAPYALAADTKGNIWFSATAEIGDSGGIGRLAGVVGVSPVTETTPTGTSTTRRACASSSKSTVWSSTSRRRRPASAAHPRSC